MAEEFQINSSAIEDKINQLLPSQGGFGAGVDFSASTMVIPIIDLTETAEGSAVRQDLQTALSFTTANAFNVNNTTTTVITTTGYYRIVGTSISISSASGTPAGEIIINDGSSDKVVWGSENYTTSVQFVVSPIAFDLVVFLSAGDSLKVKSSSASAKMIGSVRQIADLSGNLTNP